tara:strand:- start:250 stop:624 length:375 start_codon:yes stop_codon:yes gene_type:complete
MTVYVKNITINTGETFSEDLTLLSADGTGVVDLTGFTAQSQLRKTAANYQFADIQVGITSAAEGAINISLASTITEVWRPGRYMYDIILTRPSGFKFVAVEGSALVRSGITTFVHLYGSPGSMY